MSMYTIPAPAWNDLKELTEVLKRAREKVFARWEGLADDLKFVAPTVSIVDEEAGVIEAEPRPSPGYLKHRKMLLVADALREMPEVDRVETVRLAELPVKISLAEQIAWLQEGAGLEAAATADHPPVGLDFNNMVEVGEPPKDPNSLN